VSISGEADVYHSSRDNNGYINTNNGATLLIVAY